MKSCAFPKLRTEMYNSCTGVLKSRCFGGFDSNLEVLDVRHNIVIVSLSRVAVGGATATIMLYPYQSVVAVTSY